MRFIKPLFYLLIICISVNVYATGYRFTHITTADGLSGGLVLNINQDSLGFIWIATDFGLNRYDGYEFKHYFNIPGDSTSLASNKVKYIFIDRVGEMWVKTEDYLNHYHPDNDNFTRYRIPDTNRLYTDSYYVSMTEDCDGDIWIGNFREGLYFFNTKEKAFTDLTYLVDSLGVSSVYCDDGGTLWFGTGLWNLFSYDKSTGVLNKYTIPFYDEYLDGFIWFIEPYGKGKFILGTAYGLVIFDTKTKNFSKFKSNLNERVNIRAAYVSDKLPNVYVSLGKGVFIEQDGVITNYKADLSNKYSVNSNVLTDVFCDKTGVYWIASVNGISLLDIDNNSFEHFQNRPNDRESLTFNDVLCITEANNGDIWLGTSGDGLNVMDIKTKKFYKKEIETRQLFDLHSSGIIDMHTVGNNIWIAAEGLLIKYDQENKTFDAFKSDYFNYNKRNKKREYSIQSIDHDGNGNLWLGIKGGGICNGIYDNKAKKYKFINYVVDSSGNSLVSNMVSKVFVDHENNVWIGTLGKGLDFFDTKTKQFTHFPLEADDSFLQQSNIINCIYEDSYGKIWVGTEDGVVSFNKEDSSFSQIYNYQNTPYTRVRSLFRDTKSNIWIATGDGLYRHNLLTGDVKIFGAKDGLFNESFNKNALFYSSDSLLYLGGYNGFSVFKPEEVKIDTIPPRVVFTGLFINNHKVIPKVSVNGEIVLDKSIFVTDTLILPPFVKRFTIEFAALHYASPEKNMYKYKLQGFDDDWIEASSDNRKAIYSSLPAGDYTLFVMASNKDGVWSKQLSSIFIKIKPPWWQTAFFKLIVIVFILLLLFTIYYLTIRILQKQKKILEDKVSERTRELSDLNVMLEESREEVFKQNEELVKHRNHLEELVKERTKELEKALVKAEESDRLKSAFLANMSHEIRTPLNAIIGFSSFFKDKHLSEEEIESYVNIIQNNSDALLTVINDIIDISVIEAGQLTLSYVEFSVDEVLTELESIYKLKIDNSLSIEFVGERGLILNCDVVRFRQIMTNLINNALKFTQRGYIHFGYKVTDNIATFFVQDTGAGISPEDGRNIFRYFQKVSPTPNKFYSGTGLGLTITNELISKMGGEIWFESDKDIGTTFRFTIPL